MSSQPACTLLAQQWPHLCHCIFGTCYEYKRKVVSDQRIICCRYLHFCKPFILQISINLQKLVRVCTFLMIPVLSKDIWHVLSDFLLFSSYLHILVFSKCIHAGYYTFSQFKFKVNNRINLWKLCFKIKTNTYLVFISVVTIHYPLLTDRRLKVRCHTDFV